MAEKFSGIHFEAYINSAWVNLTPDVQINPAPKWNRGIMGNDVLARVGSPGYFSFSLDNSEHNSASTLGYYSPGNINALPGWTTGIPVRLYFEFDGMTYYKYYGRIMPDGIKVHPGYKEDRLVEVRGHDFMSQAQIHELRLLTLQENKRIDEVVPLVVANMPIAPLATDYNTGSYTFTTVFDSIKTSTTAQAEFQKLANSEIGYIYVRGDITGGETLVVDGNQTRQFAVAEVPISEAESGFLLKEDGDYLLLEDGDRLILSQTQEANFTDSELSPGTEINYGNSLINTVEVATYPRKIDAAATTILFSLQSQFSIGASESKLNYFGRYRDPSGGASYVNGRDMVVPTTDDFLAETTAGVDATTDVTLTTTFGTEGVSYDLVNNVASERVIKTLRARGKGIYLYDAVRVIYESTDSQEIHGKKTLSIDMRYQDDPTIGEYFSNFILSQCESPFTTVDRAVIFANKNSMSMFGFLSLEPGDKIRLSETVSGIDNEFFIQGYEAEIFEGQYVWWKPILQNSIISAGPWIWDVSTWDYSTNWAS